VPERSLYIVAYDVSDPRRQDHVRGIVRRYAAGGQKSVYECFLTPWERDALLRRAGAAIDHRTDRIFVLRLDPRSPVHTLGIAVPPSDAPYFYAG